MYQSTNSRHNSSFKNFRCTILLDHITRYNHNHKYNDNFNYYYDDYDDS